jgi:hypothetical protein
MNIVGFKIGMLFVMFFEVFLGLIPKACSTGKQALGVPWLSLLNSFSAGIFLAIALVHTMPETQEVWRRYSISVGYENPFPLPFILFLAGYCLILLIDKVIFSRGAAAISNKVASLPTPRGEAEMK